MPSHYYKKNMSRSYQERFWRALGLPSSGDADIVAAQEMVTAQIRAVHEQTQAHWIAKGRDPEHLLRSHTLRPEIKRKFVDPSAELPEAVRNLDPGEAGEAMFNLYAFYRHHEPSEWGLSPLTQPQRERQAAAQERESYGETRNGEDSTAQAEPSYQTEEEVDAAVLEHVGGWLESQKDS